MSTPRITPPHEKITSLSSIARMVLESARKAGVPVEASPTTGGDHQYANRLHKLQHESKKKGGSLGKVNYSVAKFIESQQRQSNDIISRKKGSSLRGLPVVGTIGAGLTVGMKPSTLIGAATIEGSDLDQVGVYKGPPSLSKAVQERLIRERGNTAIPNVNAQGKEKFAAEKWPPMKADAVGSRAHKVPAKEKQTDAGNIDGPGTASLAPNKRHFLRSLVSEAFQRRAGVSLVKSTPLKTSTAAVPLGMSVELRRQFDESSAAAIESKGNTALHASSAHGERADLDKLVRDNPLKLNVAIPRLHPVGTRRKLGSSLEDALRRQKEQQKEQQQQQHVPETEKAAAPKPVVTFGGSDSHKGKLSDLADEIDNIHKPLSEALGRSGVGPLKGRLQFDEDIVTVSSKIQQDDPIIKSTADVATNLIPSRGFIIPSPSSTKSIVKEPQVSSTSARGGGSLMDMIDGLTGGDQSPVIGSSATSTLNSKEEWELQRSKEMEAMRRAHRAEEKRKAIMAQEELHRKLGDKWVEERYIFAQNVLKSMFLNQEKELRRLEDESGSGRDLDGSAAADIRIRMYPKPMHGVDRYFDLRQQLYKSQTWDEAIVAFQAAQEKASIANPLPNYFYTLLRNRFSRGRNSLINTPYSKKSSITKLSSSSSFSGSNDILNEITSEISAEYGSDRDTSILTKDEYGESEQDRAPWEIVSRVRELVYQAGKSNRTLSHLIETDLMEAMTKDEKFAYIGSITGDRLVKLPIEIKKWYIQNIFRFDAAEISMKARISNISAAISEGNTGSNYTSSPTRPRIVEHPDGTKTREFPPVTEEMALGAWKKALLFIDRCIAAEQAPYKRMSDLRKHAEEEKQKKRILDKRQKRKDTSRMSKGSNSPEENNEDEDALFGEDEDKEVDPDELSARKCDTEDSPPPMVSKNGSLEMIYLSCLNNNSMVDKMHPHIREAALEAVSKRLNSVVGEEAVEVVQNTLYGSNGDKPNVDSADYSNDSDEIERRRLRISRYPLVSSATQYNYTIDRSISDDMGSMTPPMKEQILIALSSRGGASVTALRGVLQRFPNEAKNEALYASMLKRVAIVDVPLIIKEASQQSLNIWDPVFVSARLQRSTSLEMVTEIFNDAQLKGTPMTSRILMSILGHILVFSSNIEASVLHQKEGSIGDVTDQSTFPPKFVPNTPSENTAQKSQLLHIIAQIEESVGKESGRFFSQLRGKLMMAKYKIGEYEAVLDTIAKDLRQLNSKLGGPLSNSSNPMSSTDSQSVATTTIKSPEFESSVVSILNSTLPVTIAHALSRDSPDCDIHVDPVCKEKILLLFEGLNLNALSRMRRRILNSCLVMLGLPPVIFTTLEPSIMRQNIHRSKMSLSTVSEALREKRLKNASAFGSAAVAKVQEMSIEEEERRNSGQDPQHPLLIHSRLPLWKLPPSARIKELQKRVSELEGDGVTRVGAASADGKPSLLGHIDKSTSTSSSGVMVEMPFTDILLEHAKDRNWEGALRILPKLPTRVSPSQVSALTLLFNCVISASVEQAAVVEQVVEIMRQTNADLNATTYNTMISAYARDHQRWEKALEVFQAMPRKIKDSSSYSAAISVLNRIDQWEKSLATYADAAKVLTKPSAVLYGLTIQAAHRHSWETTLIVFRDLVQKHGSGAVKETIIARVKQSLEANGQMNAIKRVDALLSGSGKKVRKEKKESSDDSKKDKDND